MGSGFLLRAVMNKLCLGTAIQAVSYTQRKDDKPGHGQWAAAYSACVTNPIFCVYVSNGVCIKG